jgi:hypothetical protein
MYPALEGCQYCPETTWFRTYIEQDMLWYNIVLIILPPVITPFGLISGQIRAGKKYDFQFPPPPLPPTCGGGGGHMLPPGEGGGHVPHRILQFIIPVGHGKI